MMNLNSCTVVSCLAPSPHSKSVSGLNLSWGLSVWSGACSTCMGSLWVLRLPHTVKLIGDSKLTLGVRVHDCLSG